MRPRLRAALLACGVALAGPAGAEPGGDYPSLLAQGERALKLAESGLAVQAYERATSLRHAAVAEWGLVRSWMQSGDYRRALGFAAHAAGAHPDVVAGAGLYAWLLHIGGQPAVARSTLEDALRRHPNDPLLHATAARLAKPAAAPDTLLLDGATRQGPHTATALPAEARAVASGWLHADGQRALVPTEALERGATVWLRDAFGRAAVARLVREWPEIGFVELALDAALREPLPPLPLAPRDAFPGSPELALEFPAGAALPAFPAWPLLRTGFVGAWQRDGHYVLGTALAAAGPHGGPVFDREGRLIGLARRADSGAAVLVAASALQRVWPAPASVPAAPQVPALQLSPDALYERAMGSVVQVIVVSGVAVAGP